MTNSKYVVIGGQYERQYYGTCDTLLAAKRLATKNTEYWDNGQGWHTPAIYAIEDTWLVTTDGMITYNDGAEIRVPRPGAGPIYTKVNGKWC